MKTILVPTDFSDHATYALDLAYDIAKKSGAAIKLLNVVEAPHGSSFNAMGEVTTDDTESLFFVQLVKGVKQRLLEIDEDPKYADVKLDGFVEVGNPYENIARTIADQEVDLVVMGTQGSSGLEEVFVGSNAEKAVRYSNCPVLTVKEPVHANAIKDIVLATNLRDDHQDLFSQLTKIQQLFDATIHIVRINTPSSFENDRYYKSEMQKFAEQYGLTNYTLNVYNDSDEEDGIIYFAEQVNADMIAMGTHGRSGISRILSGSIAEDVVNHSKRPVWTFKLK